MALLAQPICNHLAIVQSSDDVIMRDLVDIEPGGSRFSGQHHLIGLYQPNDATGPLGVEVSDDSSTSAASDYNKIFFLTDCLAQNR